jgi:hypothetical protein
VAAGSAPSVLGIDRHPWAADEARWTYRHFGLRGQARVGDASRLPPLRRGSAVIAAYAMNELSPGTREQLEAALLRAAGAGVRILIVEPIARAATPWWDDTAARVGALGGRADEWRFPIELPPLLTLLDKAAGLSHRELTARSLYCAGA